MKKTALVLLTATALLLPACTTAPDNASSSSVISDVTTITLNGSDAELSLADTAEMDFEFTDRDRDINSKNEKFLTPDKVDGEYLITKEGSYILSGEISETPIHIKAGDTDKIQLVLDNAKITSTDSPAIYIESADKVFITLKEDSENEIIIGNGARDETLDGAIFSRDDLTINGKGKLTISTDYKHGIVSKDDLVIVDATLDVTAINVALNGKDCIKISNATLDLKSGSDGIRSDNAEDASRGFVYIESGDISINASNDGIQAETIVKIQTADIKIVSGGGSSGRISNSEESYKGIKAVSDVIIKDGKYDIDALDDAIHSNNSILIENGCFSLSTSDDGIHADSDFAIVSGELTVKKSYEAIEAGRIFISGGTLDLTASDDGLNAAGGNDQSASSNPQNPSDGKRPQGGFGMDMFDNGVGEIYISGGYTHMNASGDGVDSNGSIEVSGGVTLVSGPTNGGNGALDYGKSATVAGGVFIATGSSGMAQGFSAATNQGAMLINVGNLSANVSIAICDENGKCIASFTPDKSYQAAVITAPEIQQGKKYSIYSSAEVANADKFGYASNSEISKKGTLISEITMDNILYGSGGGFGGPGGDFGGGGNRPGGNKGDRPSQDFGGDNPPDMSFPQDFGGGYPPDMSAPPSFKG